jgi:ABC-2 type transport system permease protein
MTAFVLASRRDVGRGLLPERRGPAVAGRGLLSPLGLAWRLQSSLFLGWAAGMAVFGLFLGALLSEVEGLGGIEEVAELIELLGGEAAIQDTTFALLMGVTGLVIAVYTVQVLLRMRSEEAEGPLESVLATAVPRWQWLMGHVATAALGTTALLLIVGVGTGLAAGLVTGDLERHLRDLTMASLVQAPATFALGGVVIAAFGLLPRWAGPLAWTAFAVALVTGPFFGAMLDLPQALSNLSPFTHSPMVPVEDVTVLPIAVLLAIAAALTLAGILAFQRRDLASRAG